MKKIVFSISLLSIIAIASCNKETKKSDTSGAIPAKVVNVLPPESDSDTDIAFTNTPEITITETNQSEQGGVEQSEQAQKKDTENKQTTNKDSDSENEQE